MNKNFTDRFAIFLRKKINSSTLNKYISINSICIGEHDIRDGKYTFLSTDTSFNKHIYLKNSIFSKQGAATIRKTSGYYMQPELNPNAQISEQILKTRNLFIRTEITQHTFIEIVIDSKKKIETDQEKALATILFKDILKTYYKETKNIKVYELQNHEQYARRHKKDLADEMQNCEAQSPFDVNFNWQIDENRSLNTKHMQIIIGIMLQYDNSELKRYFNISKESKKQNLDKIKEIFQLDATCKTSEVLRKAKSYNIVNSLEQAFGL